MQSILPRNLGLRKDTAFALLISAIVVLVGVGSFGIGRLTALRERQGGNLAIYAAPNTAAVALAVPVSDTATEAAPPDPAVSDRSEAAAPAAQAPVAHNFVASKNGTKYYAPTCSGASRIKPANEVWFATEADAKSAGYTLSATCK
jgi:hypothetical protein